MSKTTKLAAVQDEVIEAYKNGSTMTEIAKLHDASAGTIRNILDKAKVEIRPRGRRKKETTNGVEQQTL
jgi:transposase-like protein